MTALLFYLPKHHLPQISYSITFFTWKFWPAGCEPTKLNCMPGGRPLSWGCPGELTAGDLEMFCRLCCRARLAIGLGWEVGFREFPMLPTYCKLNIKSVFWIKETSHWSPRGFWTLILIRIEIKSWDFLWL